MMRARVPGQPQPFSIFLTVIFEFLFSHLFLMNDVLHQPYPGGADQLRGCAPPYFRFLDTCLISY